MKKGALALLLSIPCSAAAEPREIATMSILNEDAVVYDDGTWAFLDPRVSIKEQTAETCLSTGDGRVEFCPSDQVWTDRRIVASYVGEEHTFQSHDAVFQLDALVDASYGHDGEVDLYADTSGLGFSLLERAAMWAFNAGNYENQSFIIGGDVVVVLTDFAQDDIPLSTTTIEVMTSTETLYLDLNSSVMLYDNASGQADFASAKATVVSDLWASLTIDGATLATLAMKDTE
jgi:hypothetical protein